MDEASVGASARINWTPFASRGLPVMSSVLEMEVWVPLPLPLYSGLA